MKGCLIAGLLIAAVFGVVGFAAVKFYQSAAEGMPEYATREAVYERYGTLIQEVQAAIDASESMYDLAARLEKIDAPDELIYLTLTKENERFDDKKIEVIEKMEISSSSHTIINGTGHGKLNGIEVIVVNLPVDRYSIEDCTMYLKYRPDPAATSQ